MNKSAKFIKFVLYTLISTGLLIGCVNIPKLEFNPKENLPKIDVPLKTLSIAFIGQEGDFSTTPLFPGFNRVNDKMFHPTPGEMLKLTLKKMVNLNPIGKDADLMIVNSALYLQSVGADFIPILGMISQANSERLMKCEAVIVFKFGNDVSRSTLSVTRLIDGNGNPAADCQTDIAVKILDYIKTKI